jgi:hypothetical protein
MNRFGRSSAFPGSSRLIPMPHIREWPQLREGVKHALEVAQRGRFDPEVAA